MIVKEIMIIKKKEDRRIMEIYGTIGPACGDLETLKNMFCAGMTGIRLNVSHEMLADAKDWMENIHKAAKESRVCPQLLIDLQGPELRVGDFGNAIENLILRETEEIYLGIQAKRDTVPIPEIVLKNLCPSQQVLLDDGKMLLEVTAMEEKRARCTILRGGTLQCRKSIALPGLEVESDTLTSEDRENIKVAKAYGVTGVMLSFVRGKEDIENLRQALAEVGASDLKIYAKIENQHGIEKIDEIISSTDMVVIARGDLGNAMPLWELPRVQKEIAKKCRERGCEFMVVTQMLASMEHAKVPTRAEVSDIFNAVLDGAQAVMLTGETAVGAYPVEAMTYMAKTVEEAEKYKNRI